MKEKGETGTWENDKNTKHGQAGGVIWGRRCGGKTLSKEAEREGAMWG